MAKKRTDSDSAAAEVVARGLSTLIAGRRFYPTEASDLQECFSHITAAILTIGKLQKRLGEVEAEVASVKRLRSIA